MAREKEMVSERRLMVADSLRARSSSRSSFAYSARWWMTSASVACVRGASRRSGGRASWFASSGGGRVVSVLRMVAVAVVTVVAAAV